MILQLGKVGINCEAEISKDEFIEMFSKALAIDKIDVNEAYKKYKKQHDKLKPTKKKKKKIED